MALVEETIYYNGLFVWLDVRQHRYGYVDVSYQVDTDSGGRGGQGGQRYTIHAHEFPITRRGYKNNTRLQKNNIN
jgi:hypothetical protein